MLPDLDLAYLDPDISNLIPPRFRSSSTYIFPNSDINVQNLGRAHLDLDLILFGYCIRS